MLIQLSFLSTTANAALTAAFQATGKLELQTIGADIIEDSNGAGWHDASQTDPNDNNTFVYYNSDSDASTINSSSIDYSLVSGKTIVSATLVWGAKRSNGASQIGVNTVKLSIVDVGNTTVYTSISADGGTYDDTSVGSFELYGYYADVTSYFSGLTTGVHTVTVADIEAELGSGIVGGASGGWALYLVLENPSLIDNTYIAVYGGLQVTNPNTTVDTPITGLNTPAVTTAKTTISSSAMDGDFNRPDTYSFGPNTSSLVVLSDGLQPANDFFNSRRTYEASYYDATPGPIAGSNPSYDRVTHDVVQLNPSASFNLPGGTTDAVVRLKTGTGEGVNLTGFALSTPYSGGNLTGHLYNDLNGNGTQDVGEPDLANVDVNVTDSLGYTQTGTTGVDGNYSLAGLPVGNATVDIDESTLPAGANQTEGNDPTIVTIVIGNNTEEDNGYQMLTDLSISKTLDTSAPFIPGQSITYTIVASNAGPATATNIKVTDLPTNLKITSATGPSSSCSITPVPPAVTTSVVCTIVSLVSNANETITIQAIVP